MKHVERVVFESDENGWEMHVTDMDGFVTRFNVHAAAWDLALHASETIGEWRAEGEAVRREFRASAGDDLRTEDAQAYPPGSSGWWESFQGDVDLARDQARGK